MYDFFSFTVRALVEVSDSAFFPDENLKNTNSFGNVLDFVLLILRLCSFYALYALY